MREGTDPGSAELVSLLFVRVQKSPPLALSRGQGLDGHLPGDGLSGKACLPALPARAACAVLLQLPGAASREGGGREGVKEKNPIWINLLPRGRRGQGRVKVRAPRPMCFLLPAPLEPGDVGKEGSLVNTAAGRTWLPESTALPMLLSLPTLPTAPAPEGVPGDLPGQRGPHSQHTCPGSSSPPGQGDLALWWVPGQGGCGPAVPQRSQLQHEGFLLALMLGTSRGA